ncbi:MAG: hypothetical protein KTR19_10235 [Hyphomicrobiales bacterium]|nr:hypothetical protein [Hyphomicrobiales bacterium]
MSYKNFILQFRAAQRLAEAFRDGRTPSEMDLTVLGMPADLKDSFKR